MASGRPPACWRRRRISAPAPITPTPAVCTPIVDLSSSHDRNRCRFEGTVCPLLASRATVLGVAGGCWGSAVAYRQAEAKPDGDRAGDAAEPGADIGPPQDGARRNDDLDVAGEPGKAHGQMQCREEGGGGQEWIVCRDELGQEARVEDADLRVEEVGEQALAEGAPGGGRGGSGRIMPVALTVAGLRDGLDADDDQI